ncbi:hypothetical protein PTKIN_Ptkin11bG0191400 [Pterospermum kingtungense]
MSRERMSQERVSDSVRGRSQISNRVSHSSNPTDWRAKLFTVFVDRISKKVSKRFLWRFFKDYGKVVDVFIPKRVLNGNRRFVFAFVRFKQESEFNNAIAKANNRFIDGWHIKVSRENHDKKEIRKGKMKSCDARNSCQEDREVALKDRDGRSYRDVVIGEVEPVVCLPPEQQVSTFAMPLKKPTSGNTQHAIVRNELGECSHTKCLSSQEVIGSKNDNLSFQKEEEELNQDPISFVELKQSDTVEDMEWLKCCIVGRVKGSVKWELLCKTFECLEVSCKIFPLGRVAVLFRFQSVKEMECAMVSFPAISSEVLEDLSHGARKVIGQLRFGCHLNKFLFICGMDLTSDESLFIVSKDSDRQSFGNTGCMEMESHCMKSDTAMHSGVDDYSWMLLEKCDMVEFSSRLSENEIMGMCDSTTNSFAVVNSLSTFVEDSLVDRVEPISNGGLRSGSPRWGTGYESSPIDSLGCTWGAIANRNRLIFAEGEANTEMSAALGFRYARNRMQLIATWNIRGLGCLEKRRAVRRLFSKGKLDAIFIQESKIKEVRQRLVRWLWGNIDVTCEFVVVDGNAGGLISCWNNNFFSVEAKFVSQRYILLIGVLQEINFRCGLDNVYAPNDESERSRFFDELSRVLDNAGCPWILGGDFNIVRSEEEKIGLTYNMVAMSNFSSFIESVGLVDLPLSGGRFTWSSNRDLPTFCRLDRFLCSSEVLMEFSILVQKVWPRSLSDHNPVSLESETIN